MLMQDLQNINEDLLKNSNHEIFGRRFELCGFCNECKLEKEIQTRK